MLEKFLNLPKNKKMSYLLIGGFLLLFLTYQLSISETISEWRENNNYKRSGIQNVSSSSLSKQKQQLESLNLRLKTKAKDKEELRKSLLAKVSKLVSDLKLKLVSLPEITVKNEKGFDLFINKFGIEGNYEKQVKLLNQLEKTSEYGQVVSVEWKKIKNKSTKKDQLIMSLYIQSIIFNEL